MPRPEDLMSGRFKSIPAGAFLDADWNIVVIDEKTGESLILIPNPNAGLSAGVMAGEI